MPQSGHDRHTFKLQLPLVQSAAVVHAPPGFARHTGAVPLQPPAVCEITRLS
jgi:hypothetical protein